MIRRLFLFFLLFSFDLESSDDHRFHSGYHGQGKALAAQKSPTSLPNPNMIPGFGGTQLPQSNLTPRSIESALQQNSGVGHEAHKAVVNSQRERLSFSIDPKRDPVFTASDRVTNNPLAVLEAVPSRQLTPIVETKTRHTCEEPGSPYEMACTRDLRIEVVKKVKTYAYTQVKGKQFKRKGRKYGRVVAQTRARGRHDVPHDAWYDYRQTTPLPELNINYFDGCNYYPHSVKNYYTYTKGFEGEPQTPITEAEYNSRTLEPQDIREHWVDSCAQIESLIDQNHCSYGERQCVSGPATRLVGGGSVTRPCWQERQSYQCTYPAQDTCGELKYKGCHQVGSRCARQVGATCVAYQQTYECVTRSGGERQDQLGGRVPWCLDGNCTEQGYASNRDMAESLSKLMIFKEMQKNMTNFQIFKGDAMSCDRLCLSFKDCCRKSGWGLGISGCTEGDKELGLRRQKKECVYVGTYCAEKVLGQCVRKRSSYCCFGSKLSRLVQEQGRLQLGLSFGTGKDPQCQGFTVDQITHLDFERIDLSPLFQEMFQNMPRPNFDRLSQDLSRSFQSKVPNPNGPDPSYLKNLPSQGSPHAPAF